MTDKYDLIVIVPSKRELEEKCFDLRDTLGDELNKYYVGTEQHGGKTKKQNLFFHNVPYDVLSRVQTRANIYKEVIKLDILEKK